MLGNRYGACKLKPKCVAGDLGRKDGWSRLGDSLASPSGEPELYSIDQGSPTPGLRTSTSPWPVRNRAARQEVSGGRASEASCAAPHRSHYRLNHCPRPRPPVRGKTVFHETGPWCQKGWGPLLQTTEGLCTFTEHRAHFGPCERLSFPWRRKESRQGLMRVKCQGAQLKLGWGGGSRRGPGEVWGRWRH